MTTSRRIEIYDTTLRDGSQGEGINFTLVDKLKITTRLDSLGIDFIEGGYPMSNPKDAAYFEEAAKLKLSHAKIVAFGMTRRRGVKPADDPGMKALVGSGAPIVTIVGKTWDLHVDEVLRVSRQENIDMIRESVAYIRERGLDCFYDAEHFFDGYRANPDYAVQTLTAALEGGASRLVLCDTNGGSLSAWVVKAIAELNTKLAAAMKASKYFVGLGIHVHNDGGLATANSLAAVEAGAVQVQGTINGIGERCGNVDLTTVAANLRLKMGYDCLAGDSIHRLTDASRFVYEVANLNPVNGQPFVGASAFAHKGGMHVHAVQRIAHSYEHITPDSVGNTRRVLVSELSGVSNIAATLGPKFGIGDNRELQKKVLDRVNELEMRGYQFEVATASFDVLMHEAMGTLPKLWDLDHYRCVIYKNDSDAAVTEATVKLRIGDVVEHHVAEGDGPVNALDGALRKCLEPHYPQLKDVHLRDFRVRVVNPTAESAAKVRVISEFATKQNAQATPPVATAAMFATVGVNENIVDASWEALTAAFLYHLIETRPKAKPQALADQSKVPQMQQQQ